MLSTTSHAFQRHVSLTTNNSMLKQSNRRLSFVIILQYLYLSVVSHLYKRRSILIHVAEAYFYNCCFIDRTEQQGVKARKVDILIHVSGDQHVAVQLH